MGRSPTRTGAKHKRLFMLSDSSQQTETKYIWHQLSSVQEVGATAEAEVGENLW